MPRKRNKTTLKKVAKEVRALKRDTTSMKYPLWTFPPTPGADLTTPVSVHHNLASPTYSNTQWALNGATGLDVIQGSQARLVAINYKLHIFAGTHNAEAFHCRFIWYVTKKATSLTAVAPLPELLTPGSVTTAYRAKHEGDNYQIIAEKNCLVTPSNAAYSSGGGRVSNCVMDFTIKIPKKYQRQVYDASLTGSGVNQICFLACSQAGTASQPPYISLLSTQEMVYVDQE